MVKGSAKAHGLVAARLPAGWLTATQWLATQWLAAQLLAAQFVRAGLVANLVLRGLAKATKGATKGKDLCYMPKEPASVLACKVLNPAARQPCALLNGCARSETGQSE